MKPTRASILVLFVLVMAWPMRDGRAQSEDLQPSMIHPQGSVGFIVGVPQGAFRDNVDDLGFGVDVFGGLGFGQSPVVLGLNVGFLIYGREKRKAPFSTTIPDVTVEVTTTNNILKSHLVLRVQPPEGTLRPYLDGLFGLKYLFTQTRVENEGFGQQEAIAQSTNFDDVALSYGLGGGVAIELYRPQPTTPEKKTIEALELRLGAEYLFGSEAEYLREGPIEDINGNGRIEESELDVQRSRTALLVPQLGVSVRF